MTVRLLTLCCPNVSLKCRCQQHCTVSVMPMYWHHTRKVVSKNQIILTSSSRDNTVFVSPCFSDLFSYKHLQQCLCLLCQLKHLLHLNLSFIKSPSICRSPHMTGMHLTRCVSLDCSSTSLICGFGFTRSRLRNAWTTYYASWARKVMQLWTVGSQLMIAHK